MARYPTDKRIVIPGHIPFGGQDPNAKYGRHSGDDSANPLNTPVYAPVSGTVTPYTYSQYHGNVVELFDGTYYPHVFHLNSRAVSPGDTVTEGQLIGYSGNTGLSTGAHVHFGVSTKSVPKTTSFNDFVDPIKFINEEEDMPKPTYSEVLSHFRSYVGFDPTEKQMNYYVARDWGTLNGDLLQFNTDRLKEAREALGKSDPKKLERLKKDLQDLVNNI